MGKIKGWEKVRDNEWRHNSKRISEGYDYRGNKYPMRFVRIVDNRYGYLVHPLEKVYKTLREAKYSATAYMRSHPNG